MLQNDMGPAIATEAEAKHSQSCAKEMNMSGNRTQGRPQHEVISGATQLRLEFVQDETRLQHQEGAVRAAGERMLTSIRSEETSQKRRKALDVKLKFHKPTSMRCSIMQSVSWPPIHKLKMLPTLCQDSLIR